MPCRGPSPARPCALACEGIATPVVLAKAGTQFSSQDALILANARILRSDWIPAFAGMSGESKFLTGAHAGTPPRTP
jgi:hypothetical protein